MAATATTYNHHQHSPDITVNCKDEHGIDEPGPDSDYESDFVKSKLLSVGCSFDAIQYLFPCRQRDYLIRRKEGCEVEKIYAEYLEGKRYVVICTLYIPVKEDDEVACVFHELQDCFSDLAKEKHDFGVVLVPRMRSNIPNNDNEEVANDAFSHFFSAFSPLFLVVPILDRVRSRHLFEVIGSPSFFLPCCIVVDLEKQQVSHTNITAFTNHGSDFYPFTAERLLEVREQANTMLTGRMPLEIFLHRESSDVLHCQSHSGSCCDKKQSLSNLTNKVVWLYYLCNGRFINKLRYLYRKFKADKDEFELVVVRRKSYMHTPLSMSASWEKRVDSMLQDPYCCGWLQLPLDDRVSRRLFYLCKYTAEDKLVIVGPNSSYVEPDGKEVFLEFGTSAYPFTKQSVRDNEVLRLRCLRLQDWLECWGIESLRRVDEEIIPVSDLQNADVLVYFGSTSSTGMLKCDWDCRIFNWVDEMRTAAKGRFEVIFLCTGEDPKADDAFSLDTLCAVTKWLLPVPFDYDWNKNLLNSLLGCLRVCDCTLAAFGPKGNLLCLGLEHSLTQQSEPATFPESDEDLVADVGKHLNSRHTDDIWYRALDIYRIRDANY